MGKNKIPAINAWAVAVFRYGTGILQWKESELKDVDWKSRGKNGNVWSVTILKKTSSRELLPLRQSILKIL